MRQISLFALILLLAACGRSPAPQATLETQAATINVNTTSDEFDNVIPNSNCSLREAIVSANENHDIGGCSHSGSYASDTIRIPAGIYNLTRVESCPLVCNDQDWGDLDILSNVTLDGVGPTSTIIKGGFVSSSGRVLQIGNAGEPRRTATIKDLKLTSGSSIFGSGLLNRNATTRVENVIVENNIATRGLGAGIFNLEAGTLTIVNSIIKNNRTFDSGGAIANSATLIILGSTISGNQALAGGGIHQEGNTASSTITNTTISGNRVSDRAGGINSNGGVIDLINVTITANSADGIGGGLGAGGGIVRGGGEFRLGNTIVAANTAITAPDCTGPFSTTGNNLIGIRISTCTGFTSQSSDITGSATSPRNPQLGPLADNGGPTQTHALLAGSPALDLANPATCPAVDQRGVARALDGNNDGFTICDIGAFELANPAKADLSIVLSDTPDPALTNSTFDYVVTVTNNGPDRAISARAKLTLPLSSFITFNSAPSGCTRSGNTVECSLGNINNGITVTRTISVNISLSAPADKIEGIASVTSKTPDSNTTNDNDTETTTIVSPSADLLINITSPDSSVLVGSTFIYTLSIANNGPNTATNIVISQSLPSNVSFQSGSNNCSVSGSTVTCTIASLGPDTGLGLGITVLANIPGTFFSSVFVNASTPDPVNSNNLDSVNMTITLPSTDINVAIPTPAQNSNAPRNTDLTYNVRVRNMIPPATVNAENVVLTVTFPNNVSNIRPPTGCTLSGFIVTCNIGAIPFNSNVLRAITVHLPNTATSLAVTALATLSNPDPNTANNQLTRTINVQ
jgi:uncharacterized repeat protein (TIGR01451 family)/CSLREA domain-containing protein